MTAKAWVFSTDSLDWLGNSEWISELIIFIFCLWYPKIILFLEENTIVGNMYKWNYSWLQLYSFSMERKFSVFNYERQWTHAQESWADLSPFQQIGYSCRTNTRDTLEALYLIHTSKIKTSCPLEKIQFSEIKHI